MLKVLETLLKITIKRALNLCMIQRQKPQNTFNTNKTPFNQHTSNAQALTQLMSFDLHLKVEGIG